jgi:hypothetical protein
VAQTWKLQVAVAGVGLALLGGCGGKKTEGPVVDKAAAETAVTEMRDHVALIAVYLPYLRDPEKEKREAYSPPRRPDVLQAAFYACNEIRHTANIARQVAARSSSPIAKELADPMTEVAKICADPRDPEVIARCAASIKSLDAALEKAAGKASATGSTTKFPRVAPDFVDDKARAAIANFLKAIGPNEPEKKYLAMIGDGSATPEAVRSACDAASAEHQGIETAMAPIGEELRKLAVHHRLALESQCNRLGYADGATLGVETCKKDKKGTECTSGCGRSKKVLDDGIPAAAFAKLAELYQEFCVEDAGAK